MQKTISRYLGVMCASVLVGCAGNGNQIKLGDKVYTPDGDGAVVLSKSEMDAITRMEGVKFVKGQFPNIKLTEAEYHLVKENDEALFSLVGQADPDSAVATLIRPGSFADNLERIVTENNWNALYYDGPDYFVKDISVVEEESVSGAIMNVAADYPVYTCFDEKEKVVTVIRAE